MNHLSSTELSAGRSPDTDAAAAVRALCSQLFAEPERLVKAHAFPIPPASPETRRLRARGVGAHAHFDLLQLDVALRCRGYWLVDGRKYEVRGDTLMVFYPQNIISIVSRPAGRCTRAQCEDSRRQQLGLS
jgi:hypothetical protein